MDKVSRYFLQADETFRLLINLIQFVISQRTKYG